MAENPLGIQIPANVQGNVNCVADATRFQRVTLTVPGETIVLQGTGLGVPMQTPDGRTSPAIPPSGSAGYELSARFECAPNGPEGPFELSVANPAVSIPRPPFTIVQTYGSDPGSDDAIDQLLTLVLATDEAPSPALAAALSADLGDAGKLELHAKTCYDDPRVEGCDEHYIKVVQTGTEQNGRASWGGTGWTAKQTAAWAEPTVFGGYLNVYVQLVDCPYAGLEEAVLTLSCQLGYWGSSWPTGGRSAEWTATLTNSPYRVTRVTN